MRTCPLEWNNSWKQVVIPHSPNEIFGKDFIAKGLARAMFVVGEVIAYQAMAYSWSERTISHTGTEIRPRLLRKAAVRNFGQWRKL